jgi:hypothetical protein
MCPRGWVSRLIPPILQNFELMDEDDVEELKNWNQDVMNRTE